jgi:hypothetical protein
MQLSKKHDDLMPHQTMTIKTCRCPHCRDKVIVHVPEKKMFDRRGYLDFTRSCLACRKLMYVKIPLTGKIQVLPVERLISNSLSRG